MKFVWFYKLISDLIGIFMPIYFVNRVMMNHKKNSYILYSFLMVISYFFTSILNNIYSLGIFFYYMLFIIVLLYPIVFRPGTISKKIFLVLFCISGMQTIEVFGVAIINLLTKVLFDNPIENFSMENFSIENYKIVLIIRVVELIFIYIISKNIDFVRRINSKILLMLSVFCIANSLIADFILQYTFAGRYNSNNFMIVISFGLFFIQIATYYMMNSLSKIMEEKFVLEFNLKSKQNDEDIMRIHKDMRGWRHDMRNHINIILGLLERNAYDEAIKYIREVDKCTSEFEEIVYTENIAIDSVLSSKVNLAREIGVEIQLDLNITGEIKLSNIEICTLLGNLLDNSIEACEKVEEGKFIFLKIIGQEDKLIIRLKNSTNGKLNKYNGIFKTTKDGGIHGIGLSQIDSVIEKYNGYVKRIHEDNVFDTSIMINY